MPMLRTPGKEHEKRKPARHLTKTLKKAKEETT